MHKKAPVFEQEVGGRRLVLEEDPSLKVKIIEYKLTNTGSALLVNEGRKLCGLVGRLRFFLLQMECCHFFCRQIEKIYAQHIFPELM